MNFTLLLLCDCNFSLRHLRIIYFFWLEKALTFNIPFGCMHTVVFDCRNPFNKCCVYFPPGVFLFKLFAFFAWCTVWHLSVWLHKKQFDCSYFSMYYYVCIKVRQVTEYIDMYVIIYLNYYCWVIKSICECQLNLHQSSLQT